MSHLLQKNIQLIKKGGMPSFTGIAINVKQLTELIIELCLSEKSTQKKILKNTQNILPHV